MQYFVDIVHVCRHNCSTARTNIINRKKIVGMQAGWSASYQCWGYSVKLFSSSLEIECLKDEDNFLPFLCSDTFLRNDQTRPNKLLNLLKMNAALKFSIVAGLKRENFDRR